MTECPHTIMYVSGLQFLSWRLHIEVLQNRAKL
jgi:hypothetical protein